MEVGPLEAAPSEVGLVEVALLALLEEKAALQGMAYPEEQAVLLEGMA